MFDIVRGDAHYPISACLQQFLALMVMLDLSIMYQAIDLNDERPRDAEEINDERSDGVLAAKLHPEAPPT